MVAHCIQSEGVFPLREMLLRYEPGYEDTVGDKGYLASAIPELDWPRIAYFAASVFWRSAVKDWQTPIGMLPRLEIGNQYEERLRQFLLGRAPFPETATLIVDVWPPPETRIVLIFPQGGRVGSFHRYSFSIPGIYFSLWLGQTVPPEIEQACIVRHPSHPVWVTGNAERKMKAAVHGTLAKLRKNGKGIPPRPTSI